ncbi:MAG TPA: response regulator transcription factor [Pyrinomonadaceae bacterium]|jgi:DNA-binding NarL/FixJ family response regulator
MHAAVRKLNSIRILLVDDHRVMRLGLRLLIEKQQGLTVVGEASGRTDALEVAEREQPDIILLDLTLPGTDGIDLIPELLAVAEKARILVLTGVLEPEAHTRAMRLGAMGVVLKEKAPEVLIKAIEKVHDGEIWLDRGMVANVFSERLRVRETRRQDPEAAKIATLTAREREVIALVGHGLRNKQIADRLFISEGTVRNHLTTVFSKLEVSDRFELLMYAYKNGIAKPAL